MDIKTLGELMDVDLSYALLGAVALISLVAGFFVLRSKRNSGRISTAQKSPQVTSAVASDAPKEVSESERVSLGLSRSKVFFQQTFDRLFTSSKGEDFFNELEECLLSADIGIDFSERIVAELRKSFGIAIPPREQLHAKLSEILNSYLPAIEPFDKTSTDMRPHVVMIVGVNGAGKTTTVAKLCQRFRSQNKKILVGAADTFRAAATEQLKTWVERVGAEGVFQKEGSDPSAVAFDTTQAAVARGMDLCLIDTAGRLHTKSNLMEELKKMKRVITKAMPGAPHDTWLVVDGSTGQNALNQAREFHQHLQLTGIVVTKLDGSAKGGAVLAIASELKLPIVFVGVGESAEDLVPFDGPRFIEALLAGI